MPPAPDPATVPVLRAPNLPDSWDSLVLPVDKPRGYTSFDVIRRLRRISPIRKIGHAGTLDPMATGLLICLSGKATRLMNYFLGFAKIYSGVLRLGESTPSYDADTEVTRTLDASGITGSDLEKARQSFLGEIRQTTPVYSAARVKGERLYKKARRGESVTLPQRIVQVDRFDLGPRTGDDVAFEVVCSTGTYIRSLAHELGEALGVGAHLTALRRESIGPVSVGDAWPLEDLLHAMEEQNA